MGKVGEFFGHPGRRPMFRHRANIPVIKSDCEYEESCNEKNDPKNDETICRVDSFNNSSSDSSLNDVHLQDDGNILTTHNFTGLSTSRTDKVLDWMVMVAGSQFMFFLIWIILIIWIVTGIIYNGPFNWQVVMQDGQSIQCYVWDTLLMRQQLNSTHEQILIISDIRSRLASFSGFFERLSFACIKGSKESDVDTTAQGVDESSNKSDINCDCEDKNETTEFIKTGELPVENWYDNLCTKASYIIGSIPMTIAFWLGVMVWIVCGIIPKDAGNSPPFTGETTGSNPKLKKFSDTWQMYINTAVAVSLLICSTFLQNIRARHDKFIAKFLLQIYDLEHEIDTKLRTALNDYDTLHPIIEVAPVKRSKLEVIIDWYADVIGTGIGVVVAIIVFGVWIGIGQPLHWNDNWWLIIGTYTGLVGFLDGYIIRQVYFKIIQHEENNFQMLADEDMALFQRYNIPCEDEYFGIKGPVKMNWNLKISTYINYLCASQWSVVCSVLIILGLIGAASGLKWSTTGQLIANTPTMIIEEFFLIVLIQAHNEADLERRKEVTALYMRRKLLLNYVKKELGISH